MNVSPIESGCQNIRLDSFEEFSGFIVNGHLNNDTFIYRGHSDTTWKLESTIDRLERRFPTKTIYGNPPTLSLHSPSTRQEHLHAFKTAARAVRKGPDDLSDQEWWAVAQHHGLATPLLDWTLSPFAALFFAFEEVHAGDVAGDKSPDRAVYCALSHIIRDSGKANHPKPTVFVPQRALTSRLSSQVSVLMEMPKGTDLESNVRARFSDDSHDGELGTHARPILTKIVMPSKGRIDCLKMLEKMNINRLTLFGDLDSAAKYINSLWELNFDTPLGWLPNS